MFARQLVPKTTILERDEIFSGNIPLSAVSGDRVQFAYSTEFANLTDWHSSQC
jgi:hypothetical protein